MSPFVELSIGNMDQYSISYVNLLFVACGFLIVLITKYSFSDSEQKAEDDDSFPHRYTHFSSQSGSNSTATRRHSFSHSVNLNTKSISKRRGRRTFGIKHL